MTSDRRWTGGIANRDWAAGASGVQEIDRDRLTRGVKAYLTDCHTHRALLSPQYHPTADGAVKAIFHRTTQGAAFIRARFAEAVAHA